MFYDQWNKKVSSNWKKSINVYYIHQYLLFVLKNCCTIIVSQWKCHWTRWLRKWTTGSVESPGDKDWDISGSVWVFRAQAETSASPTAGLHPISCSDWPYTPLSHLRLFLADNDTRRQPHAGLLLVAKFSEVNGSEEGLISWRDRKRQTQQQLEQVALSEEWLSESQWAGHLWICGLELIFLICVVCEFINASVVVVFTRHPAL